MHRDPTAPSMIAEGVSRLADWSGVILLTALGWRMFFVIDPEMQQFALLVGVAGTVACWTNSRSRKNVPLLLIGYVVIGLLTTAIHQWAPVRASHDSAWFALLEPASYLLIMTVFIYGAAHVLRTPERLSWFVILVVTAVVVMAAQVAFDRARTGFVYDRGGGESLPSIPHWSGIHGVSLALTIGLPLAIAPMFNALSLARVLAGLTLATTLLVVEYLNGSRGGLVSMIFVVVAMTAMAVIHRLAVRRRLIVGFIAMVALALAGATLLWTMRDSFQDGFNFSGRTLIWKGTIPLILDHRWIGVGLGHYSAAVTNAGYAKTYLSEYGPINNAHNLFLQVAAEVGVAGALCLILYLVWSITVCLQTWAMHRTPIISMAVAFALVGFAIHSMSENFLDSRPDVERTRVLVWLLLAAALAVHRTTKRQPSQA